MAGDPHLPRLLTRTARILVLVACHLASACGQAPPPPSAATVAPEGPTRAEAPPTAPVLDDGVRDEAAREGLHRASWVRLRWPGDEVLDASLPQRLDEPVHAGSIFKLVAARAALAQGLVTSETRVVCPRRVEVGGRRADCVHPDLGRPLALDDAIAQSCNHFFARLGERLERDVLARTLRRLSNGAVTLTDAAPLPLVVLGLEGPRAGMRTWGRVAVAAMAYDAADPAGSALVRRGAIGATSSGSAAALADPGTLTLAKTGTTMPEGAHQEGHVVAWRPEIEEVVVVRAMGVPGRDAARLARAVWDAAGEPEHGGIRVGRLGAGGVPDGLATVDVVPVEDYVAGVVGAEGTAEMPTVALEALAVAARSYGLAPDGRHARDGYDMCDTTHCQVFRRPTDWSRAAAARTRGLVLGQGQRVLAVPYSAACSGVLVSPRSIWTGRNRVLTRVGPDIGQHTVPTWRADVPADDLAGALRQAGYRGDVLRDVRVMTGSPDGVPVRVALPGLAPAEIDATTFRHIVGRRLGWDVLKSHTWTVERTGRGYHFSGRGKGHGVGLCLAGASTLAGRGWPLDCVLAAYAPGASLRSVHDTVTVRGPSTLTADMPAVRDRLLATLAELRRVLGVAVRRDVEIVVHPTRAAYQRATGRAWWTAASTRRLGPHRYRLDLAPPAAAVAGSPAFDGEALRTRSHDLFSTVRHEFVHVLTAPVLADAPAWAAEGLAAVVADPGARPPGGPSGTCPSDEQVVRPGSLEAMREAYARAGHCVAAALPGGAAAWRRLAAR